jgi:hypothetical protein
MLGDVVVFIMSSQNNFNQALVDAAKLNQNVGRVINLEGAGK